MDGWMDGWIDGWMIDRTQKGLILKIQFILVLLLLVLTSQLSIMLMQVSNETVTSAI